MIKIQNFNICSPLIFRFAFYKRIPLADKKNGYPGPVRHLALCKTIFGG